MSVLIKGMNMPQSCYRCCFSDGLECLPKGRKVDRMTWIRRRPEWCPMEPIPPHGDLIDRNVAYDKIAEQEGGYYMDMDGVGMGLSETPVIIPAEEEA